MKLLHIIPRFLGGGPERDLIALAAAWQDSGLETQHQVLVLEPPISARLLLMARRHGMSVSAAKDRAAIHNAIETADVVEVVYWNHPALLELLRESLPSSRTVLRFTVAGLAAPQALPAELACLADALVFTARRSTASAAYRRAVATAIPVDVVSVIADMTRFEGFQRRTHQGVRVGYLGMVEPTKMHPCFAELSSAVRDPSVSFDVFGDGTWAPRLAERFEELGTADRVRFHGHVEDVSTAFADIDVFGYPLAPDSYATSEVAVQEAMWVGIPPVVLAATAPSEYVQHGVTGLVAKDDGDYPRAIERLAGDEELRRRLGLAARAFAREHFDPTRNALRLRAIVEAVAVLPRRGHDPLPGWGDPPAKLFVRGLGDLAGSFGVSLDGRESHDDSALAAAEASIATCSAVLAHGEGGVIHYRNTYPDDPHLRLWAALITLNRGDLSRAEADFQFAATHGIQPHS